MIVDDELRTYELKRTSWQLDMELQYHQPFVENVWVVDYTGSPVNNFAAQGFPPCAIVSGKTNSYSDQLTSFEVDVEWEDSRKEAAEDPLLSWTPSCTNTNLRPWLVLSTELLVLSWDSWGAAIDPCQGYQETLVECCIFWPLGMTWYTHYVTNNPW